MHAFPLLLILSALAAAPAQAQAPDEASCPATRPALPPALIGWPDQTPVSAGLKPGDGATVEVGRAALVSLHPAKLLGFTPPSKAAADASGGTLALPIAKAGTYRVALGEAAWVDLLLNGKPVASKAHAHGPQCSGIRKIVDFALNPGTYTIQLSGSSADTVVLLVARAG